MTPDQARFLFGLLLPQLESERTLTRKIVASVPFEKGGYRPAPKSRSILNWLGILPWSRFGSSML